MDKLKQILNTPTVPPHTTDLHESIMRRVRSEQQKPSTPNILKRSFLSMRLGVTCIVASALTFMLLTGPFDSILVSVANSTQNGWQEFRQSAQTFFNDSAAAIENLFKLEKEPTNHE